MPWLWRAAVLSESQLAFERAANHYASLSELAPDDRSVCPCLAEALDRAGRAAEAAVHWEKAAADAESQEEVARFRMLSATRHLYSGRIERGRTVMAELLRGEGIRVPRFPLATSLARRASLALRNHRPSARPHGDGSRAQLLLGATKGLVMVDPVVADSFAVQALAESLAVDDLEVRLQALGLEAVSLANVGGSLFRKQSQKLMTRVESLALEVGTPFARTWATLCRGTSAFFETRFVDSVRFCDQALSMFREECVGCWHETNVAMAFLIASLACTGRYLELARRLPEFRADARARGDAYSWVALHTAETYFAAIVEGDVEGYLDRAHDALAGWPAEGFTSPHYQHFYARTSCLLYLDRTGEAWSLIQQTWPKLRKAGFLQLEWLGGQLRHLRARAALRMLANGEDVGAARIVSSEAKVLRESKLPGVTALGQLALAGLRRGVERERLLEAGILNAERAGMSGVVSAARGASSQSSDAIARLLVPLA